jgi:hypothetical protein
MSGYDGMLSIFTRCFLQGHENGKQKAFLPFFLLDTFQVYGIRKIDQVHCSHTRFENVWIARFLVPDGLSFPQHASPILLNIRYALNSPGR